MLVKVPNYSQTGPDLFTVRCPSCGNGGTFQHIQGVADIVVANGLRLGQRRCPNPKCHAHIFFVRNSQGDFLRTYPAQRIDFDPNGIPERIVKSFSEALSCHAENIHVAAAIMIRRTLEELCDDKAATGKNLKDRIGALQSSVILPKELFAALDDLRLLGNDAAHIEAKTYDSIGSAEIEVAIELTKEILKAVYQLDDLVSRLRSLKKQ
jgi:hypothetical protein